MYKLNHANPRCTDLAFPTSTTIPIMPIMNKPLNPQQNNQQKFIPLSQVKQKLYNHKTHYVRKMKPYKTLQAIILLLAITSLFSCKNDDQGGKKNKNNNLIGVWQQSDFNERYDYKLYFNTENKGYSTEYIANPDSTAISTLRPFIWNTNENTLTIDYEDGGSETTQFSLNADGQLLLPALSDFPYNKL